MLSMQNIEVVDIYAEHLRYANMLNIDGGRYICIHRAICKYAKYRGGSIYMHIASDMLYANMLNIGGGRYICISREICKYAIYAKYRGGLIYMHIT